MSWNELLLIWWLCCSEAPIAAGAFSNGDVMTVSADLNRRTLAFSRNGIPIGVAFEDVVGPLIAVVTLANEESKVTIQNRPTVLNTGRLGHAL